MSGLFASPLAKLVLVLAILGAISGIAWKIRESGKDVVRLEWAEANRLQREREARQSAGAADKLEKGNVQAKIVYRTIDRAVDRVVTRVEYLDRECLDPDGLRLANGAISGEIPAPAEPDKPLPGAAVPR